MHKLISTYFNRTKCWSAQMCLMKLKRDELCKSYQQFLQCINGNINKISPPISSQIQFTRNDMVLSILTSYTAVKGERRGVGWADRFL